MQTGQHLVEGICQVSNLILWTGVVYPACEVALVADFPGGLRDAMNGPQRQPRQRPTHAEGNQNSHQTSTDQSGCQGFQGAVALAEGTGDLYDINGIAVLDDWTAIDEHQITRYGVSFPPVMLVLQGSQPFGAERERVFYAAKRTGNQVPVFVQNTRNLALGQGLEGLVAGKLIEWFWRWSFVGLCIGRGGSFRPEGSVHQFLAAQADIPFERVERVLCLNGIKHNSKDDQSQSQNRAVQQGQTKPDRHRSFLPQHVSHAAHGLDQARAPISFELFAQVADIDFQHVVIAPEVVAPDIVQDLPAL